MSSISFLWLLGALLAPFALAALILASLERVRALRPSAPHPVVARRAQAVDVVLVIGGALILAAGTLDREPMLAGMGLGFGLLGAAAFRPRTGWRLGAQGLGLALLVATFWALRSSGRHP